ncbi:MAG: hypothetical protein HQP61_01975 [Peptococcaceae bacterium]|nr:hypothetical protein [Candidatus Syntrophopropionicum ammoniitolerans]
MATLYPMTEVFFKRGFNDSSVSSEYTEEAAHVLRLHGYTPRVVDAVSHCTYIKEIATPLPDRKILSGSKAAEDPKIKEILDREFPFYLKVFEDRDFSVHEVTFEEYEKERKK